jgi:hypothetical protein
MALSAMSWIKDVFAGNTRHLNLSNSAAYIANVSMKCNIIKY